MLTTATESRISSCKVTCARQTCLRTQRCVGLGLLRVSSSLSTGWRKPLRHSVFLVIRYCTVYVGWSLAYYKYLQVAQFRVPNVPIFPTFPIFSNIKNKFLYFPNNCADLEVSCNLSLQNYFIIFAVEIYVSMTTYGWGSDCHIM